MTPATGLGEGTRGLAEACAGTASEDSRFGVPRLGVVGRAGVSDTELLSLSVVGSVLASEGSDTASVCKGAGAGSGVGVGVWRFVAGAGEAAVRETDLEGAASTVVETSV